ncbi:hypothetical protein QTQ03_18135 [Micromonospora sp. WMMA1363]|uniref:hypothetical protein n=1 Tax=Micromonospora sp. WMMA1363 TaxID=3053985 RepID=UPI00259CCD20|nr:hypothetical protein [Micromonospora sp. WMMA1363]MDM4721425.1 hypothetical protein [Micromonospora sp. WMMA1363]
MDLTAVQVRNRMVLSARLIITDHWPRVGRSGWCPVCRYRWPCSATSTAYAYLTVVGQGLWVPSDRRGRR